MPMTDKLTRELEIMAALRNQVVNRACRVQLFRKRPEYSMDHHCNLIQYNRKAGTRVLQSKPTQSSKKGKNLPRHLEVNHPNSKEVTQTPDKYRIEIYLHK
jgi:hypothetical protein